MKSVIDGIRYHFHNLRILNFVRLRTHQRSLPVKTLVFTFGYIGFGKLPRTTVCKVSSFTDNYYETNKDDSDWPLSQSIVLAFRLSYIFILFSPAVFLHLLGFVFDFSSLRKAKLLYIRFALQMSGPAFVKLGQWMSTRRDIFLPDVCNILGNLQTNCYTHPWEHTVCILNSEWGESWSDDFQDIDTVPIGSGCVAQVYKWSLSPQGAQKATAMLNHEERLNKVVAVKVLHPNVQSLISRDLRVMKMVASVLDTVYPDFYWISLKECVNEFAALMEKQVDMRIEAINIQRFKRNFQSHSSVVFPTVMDCFVRQSVLIETFEEGIHIGRIVQDSHKPHKSLANLGINALLSMLFVHNFVHCDLHPGNILVHQTVENESLVILDCGVAATLSKRDWMIFFDLFNAIVKGENERVANLLLENAEYSNCEDVEGYRVEVDRIVTTAIQQLDLKSVDVSAILSSLFQVLIKNKIKLESSFTSVMLAVMVLEGLGRSLDPDMNILDAAKPYLLSSIKDRLLKSIFG